jgi:ABC-2 type transport system permease protein
MTAVLRYKSVIKGTFLASTAYRFSLIFTFVGNLVYMVIVYFLWQRIYDNQEMMHGMTFNQTFVYLTMAASIYLLFKTYTDWGISRQIISGDIAAQLIKPIDHQMYELAGTLGFALFNGVLITIPSFVAIIVFFKGAIPLGINIPIFLVALVLAYLMMFFIDYMVGLTAFYTESIWGISASKDTIISALSGALIPLAFFPEAAQNILKLLPFQAIYNVPLQILTSPSLTALDYLRYLAVQVFWVIVLFLLSRLYFRQAIKKLVVNGG